jgi:hypothetical protein
MEVYNQIKKDLGRIFNWFAWVWLLVVIFYFVFGFTKDPTDESRWKRSGLRYYRDAGTSIEYVSDGHGGMMVRGKKD